MLRWAFQYKNHKLSNIYFPERVRWCKIKMIKHWGNMQMLWMSGLKNTANDIAEPLDSIRQFNPLPLDPPLTAQAIWLKASSVSCLQFSWQYEYSTILLLEWSWWSYSSVLLPITKKKSSHLVKFNALLIESAVPSYQPVILSSNKKNQNYYIKWNIQHQ